MANQLLNCYFSYTVVFYDPDFDDDPQTRHGVVWATSWKRAVEEIIADYGNDETISINLTPLDSEHTFEFEYNDDIIRKAGYR